MWIQRDFEGVIGPLSRQRPAVVLTGARQTGKTSLLKHLFPAHSFVTLDLPSEAALAEEGPDEFLRRHPAPLVVDEVQYAPGLFRHIKRFIDERRGERGLYLLTGSSREVDFLLHQGGRFQLFECKGTEVPSPGDAAGMEHVAGVLGPERILSRTLVCQTARPFPLGPGVVATNLAGLELGPGS